MSLAEGRFWLHQQPTTLAYISTWSTIYRSISGSTARDSTAQLSTARHSSTRDRAALLEKGDDAAQKKVRAQNHTQAVLASRELGQRDQRQPRQELLGQRPEAARNNHIHKGPAAGPDHDLAPLDLRWVRALSKRDTQLFATLLLLLDSVRDCRRGLEPSVPCCSST